MRSFRKAWSFCVSKTEREAVASDATSAPRPATRRNKSLSKIETTTENAVSKDTSPKPSSGTETAVRQATKSESDISQLPPSSDENMNPAEATPTKETFIQELITSKANSGKPSTLAEVDKDGTTSDQQLRKSIDGTSTSLGIDFSTAFNAVAHPHVILDDNSKKLTGTGAPGSHSALFGLTPDGKKEAEVDYNSSKPEPVQSVGARSGDESANLVTASLDRGVTNVQEIPSASGSSTSNDGGVDSVLSTWAVANTSLATDCISSTCDGIGGGADAGSCDASGCA
jgi:hypothetical protein